MKVKLLTLISISSMILSCSDKIVDDLEEPKPNNIATLFNRQFYGANEQLYVLGIFSEKFYYDRDKLDNMHSQIIYGDQVDEENVEFILGSASLPDHRNIMSLHKGVFIVNLGISKIIYKIFVPGTEIDFQLDTAVRVFENRRIDFLMDKLAPKDLKSTSLEQVFIGANKIKAPDGELLPPIPDYTGPRDGYQGLKDHDFNSFSGLYGETSIYGNNTIESIEVVHGRLGVDENLMDMVKADIMAVYGGVIVKNDAEDVIIETDKLIFNTIVDRTNGRFDVITTVKRKP